jgi:PKHD-type hydroxylase
MILAIADVLSAADVAEARAGLAGATFVDGKTSAGWSARLVKSNLQASAGPDLDRVRALVETRLTEHAVFVLATRPKSIIIHVLALSQARLRRMDDALLGVRSDVSFTLFLSPPESYEGGELVIDTPAGEEAFKLAPGSLVTYPATALHRVAPVTRGERLVAAGWVRSYVRDAGKRELLFDLDTARRRLFDREGKTAEADLLAKCAANLLRLWCED